jgi:hypothetical protein
MKSSQPGQKVNAESRSTSGRSTSLSPDGWEQATPLSQDAIGAAKAHPSTLTPSQVMVLQRVMGNQAVQRVLAKPKSHADEERSAGGGSEPVDLQPASAVQRQDIIQRNETERKAKVKPNVSSDIAGLEDPNKSASSKELSSTGEGSSSGKTPIDSGRHGKVLQHFQDDYDRIMTPYDKLQVDMSGRLAEFASISNDYEIEDYSAQIFGNAKVITLLRLIQEHLEEGKSDNAPFANMVSDMLLFAGLVPASQQKHKQLVGRARYTRLTARVLTPARLIENLIQIAQQAAADGDISGAQSFKGIHFDDGDSVGQRMLKLSLTNMTKTARKNLQSDSLFQTMLSSPDTVRIILAAGGAIEQDFLNTCAASAVNKEVQVNASNIASLLVIGRGVIAFIEDQLGDSSLDPSLNQKHKRTKSFKKVTIRQHARKRVNEATNVFDEIERQATAIILKRPVNVQALQSLTMRWSRIMQKLSGITALDNGVKGVPVLSKKHVKEQWMTSAVVAVLGASFLDRPLRRARPVNQGTFREAISSTLDISTSNKAQTSGNYNKSIGKNRTARVQKMDELWTKVFESGGTEFSVPGHELHLEAITQNNTKIFAVNDPKINKSQYYTTTEMEKFIRKSGEFSLREDVMSGTTPNGYLREDNVPLFTNPAKLGTVDGSTVILKRTDRILNAAPENGKNWVMVIAQTADGDKLGRVDKSKIKIL